MALDETMDEGEITEREATRGIIALTVTMMLSNASLVFNAHQFNGASLLFDIIAYAFNAISLLIVLYLILRSEGCFRSNTIDDPTQKSCMNWSCFFAKPTEDNTSSPVIVTTPLEDVEMTSHDQAQPSQ